MSNVPPPANPNDPGFVPAYNNPTYTNPPRQNVLALLSMIFGIVAFPMLACFGLGVLLGIAALIMGIISLISISKDPTLGRRGMAITGVVLGGLSFLVTPVLMFAILIPSLGRAKELANRASCSANLHGIMESNILYAAEQVTGGGGPFPAVCPSGPNVYRVQPAQPTGSTTTAMATLNDLQSPSNTLVTGSPTAGLWMLVLRGEVAPKYFLCKSDGLATVPGVQTDASGRFNQDFGQSNISYAIAYPWNAGGTGTGAWYKDTTDSTCPYVSDMPPVNGDVYSGVTVAVETAGAGGSGSPKAYNSPNHNGDGQNAAYGDVHVEWRNNPDCGSNSGPSTSDNIFTSSRSGGPDPNGVPPSPGRLGAGLIAPSAPYDIEVVPSRKNDGTTQ